MLRLLKQSLIALCSVAVLIAAGGIICVLMFKSAIAADRALVDTSICTEASHIVSDSSC